MNEPRERIAWRWIAAIFAVALVLRVVCVAQYEARHPLAQRPVIDEQSYDAWAREIAGGEVLGKQIFFQEPLYPYVLGGLYALAGDDVATQRSVARYAQATLGALSSVLIALLAARCFGRRAGLVAGFAFALHRPAVWFPTLLLKENLFLPALVGLALALVVARRRQPAPRIWFAIGALAALGALLRGNLLVLLPFFVAWPLVHTRALASLRACLLVVAGIALVLAPVVLRNYAVGGRLVLSTSGAGTNFYGGNNLDNPYGLATEFDWVRGIPEHEADDWRREASRRAGRELDATQTSSFWLDAALDSMRERPLEHARILWRKLRLSLGRYEVPDNHFLEWDAVFVPLLAWPLPGFEVTGLLALAGALLCAWDLARRRFERSNGVSDLLALAVLYLATVVLTVTSERIRLPLLALLAPFAGYFASELTRARAARWLALAGFFALAAALVLVHVLPADKRAQDFDERDFNLATRLLDEGALDAAAPLVKQLENKHPGAAATMLLAADLEWRRANAELADWNGTSRLSDSTASLIESALTRLAKVAARADAVSRHRAQVLSGAIRERLGQWAAAEADYRAALTFDADNRELRRRLARVIAEQAVTLDPGERRNARFNQALEILEQLQREQPDPELELLAQRMRSQLQSH